MKYANLKNRWKRFFRQKVIVITGSSRGIGRETARLLLQCGAAVVLNGRDTNTLQKTADEFGSTPNVLAVPADISTEAGAQHLLNKTLRHYGHVDILINNAGLSMRGNITDIKETAVHTLYQANFASAVFSTVAMLPSLLQQSGSIVFVSTVGALRGFPNISLYSASKAAVETFTQALRAEHPQLSISIVFLGFVENDADKYLITADGKKLQHTRKAHMTQQHAAQKIIHAAYTGKQRIITIPQGHILAFMQFLFPRITSRVIAKNAGKIHHSTRSTLE